MPTWPRMRRPPRRHAGLPWPNHLPRPRPLAGLALLVGAQAQDTSTCQTVYQVLSGDPTLSTAKAAVDAAGLKGEEQTFASAARWAGSRAASIIAGRRSGRLPPQNPAS